MDVVRLDAEGAEWDVLKQWVQSGVLASSVGQLLVELHNWSEHRRGETCGLVRSIMANFMLFWAARNGEKRGDAAVSAAMRLSLVFVSMAVSS